MKKLHPLTLILIALWFSSAAILFSQLLWLGIVLLMCVLFRGIVSGFELLNRSRQIAKMLPLFVMIIVIQALFVKGGNIIIGQGWYAVHTAGLNGGVSFCLRLLILFFSAQLLIRLTYEDYDTAFSALRLPEELAFMTFYTVHAIPSIAQTIRHNLQLIKLRGITLRKLSMKNKLQIYERISLAILAEVLSRSAIQAIALELRGFRCAGKHTRLYQRRFANIDWILVAGLIVLSLLCLIIWR